jgi:hypothetical protein
MSKRNIVESKASHFCRYFLRNLVYFGQADRFEPGMSLK